jgi:serine/threonine-protein kinase RsbW
MAQANIHDLHSSATRPVASVELRQLLPSTVAAISPFVDRLMSLVATCRSDGSETDIEIAVREALINAVVHGNRDDQDKLVEVVCRCSVDGDISITIRDQGKGFDVNAVPDPTIADNWMSTHGRGIYLMRALMDEVLFEEGGTVVHMRKKPNTNMHFTSSAVTVRSRLEAHQPKQIRKGKHCGK